MFIADLCNLVTVIGGKLATTPNSVNSYFCSLLFGQDPNKSHFIFCMLNEKCKLACPHNHFYLATVLSLPSTGDSTPETCIYSNWSPWSACSSATCAKGLRMRQRMLKAQLDATVPCPHTQDFEPCMASGCREEGEFRLYKDSCTHTHKCSGH